MTGSRVAKRYTAMLVGVMAILCQTAAVAQACWTGAAAPGTATLHQAAPCHDTPADPTGSGKGDMHQVRCPAQNAVTTSPGFDTFHADEMPLPAASAGIQAPDTGRAPARRPLPSRAESPPLRILHCCLRN